MLCPKMTFILQSYHTIHLERRLFMKSSQKGDSGNNQTLQPVSLSIDQLSDEALISAIAREEMWAMEPLYERYNRILYSLAYRMVADHQIAEDLLQDTFFLVWRHATLYSPQSGAARSWIVSIIHHRTIDYLRKVRRNSVLKETTWEEIKQDEQITSPDPWDKAWQ